MKYLTAGESHGQALVGIIEGIPAGLEIDEQEIAVQLARRQKGYGRGNRQKIEKDRARIITGVRYGKTLGSPIALLLENRDWQNWTSKMSVTKIADPAEPLTVPRPGHADFAGMKKYRQSDLRNILERSSARETAMRVALSAIARKLLSSFGVMISSHVTVVAAVQGEVSAMDVLVGRGMRNGTAQDNWQKFVEQAEASPVRCADQSAAKKMMAAIDQAKEKGTSVGGRFEIVATGVPVGLGSHVHWVRRLDSRIAQAVMSIPAIKAVEIGLGVEGANLPGHEFQDELFYDQMLGYYRDTNRAGGIEGGMSNGEAIVVRATMKPIPTLATPLKSVDMATSAPAEAFRERADVCAVPAAAVVGEAMLVLTLADALCEKLGGDSLEEMRENYEHLQA